MTQSLAILRFLAKKHGLCAEDDQSLSRQEMFEQQLTDFKTSFFSNLLLTHFKGTPGFEEAKIKFVKTLPDHFKSFSKFLGKNPWFTVAKLNYVDLLAYETFYWMRLLAPGILDQFDNLTQFMNRFENLPAIKAYRSSKDYISWPLFGPFFQFGYD